MWDKSQNQTQMQPSIIVIERSLSLLLRKRRKYVATRTLPIISRFLGFCSWIQALSLISTDITGLSSSRFNFHATTCNCFFFLRSSLFAFVLRSSLFTSSKTLLAFYKQCPHSRKCLTQVASFVTFLCVCNHVVPPVVGYGKQSISSFTAIGTPSRTESCSPMLHKQLHHLISHMQLQNLM